MALNNMEPNLVSMNADIALKSRLYVSGWNLSETLKFARDYPDTFYVDIHYDHERIPVGVLVYIARSGETQVFVRKSERKKGVGRTMINKLKESNAFRSTLPPNYGNGVDGSHIFFKKCLY